MTPLGVDEPAIGRLVSGLAGRGFVAIAPELPNVRGEVTPETIDALVRVARAAGQVALVGASTGAGLAILAAGDPRIARRVTAVAAIAPVASLRNLLRLGTTGYYGIGRSRQHRWSAAARRSLGASAPDDPGVPGLLANRDPGRFDALYDARAGDRALVEELSPLSRIGDVVAPVELASDPDDIFFPVDESRALAEARCDVRLTVTSASTMCARGLGPGSCVSPVCSSARCAGQPRRTGPFRRFVLRSLKALQGSDPWVSP